MPFMPLFGLGTLDITEGPSKVRSVIQNALHLGYKRIDCAPVYFNEDMIGDALQDFFSSQTKLKRNDIFLTSKLACPFHRKEHVELALRKTLSDLRVDYLDLYLIHWPVAFYPVEKELDLTIRGYKAELIDDSNDGLNIDPSISIHETWEGMENLVQKGLVRHIGVSNFPVSLLHELISKSRIPPYVNQVELHPYLQQPNLLTYCQKRGIHLQAYSPLGTPGYKQKQEPSVLKDPILNEIASNHDITVAQLCIIWAIQRGTSVVAKTQSMNYMEENLSAANMAYYDGNSNNHDQTQLQTTTPNIKLTNEEMVTIAALDKGYRYFRPEDWWGHFAMAVFD